MVLYELTVSHTNIVSSKCTSDLCHQLNLAKVSNETLSERSKRVAVDYANRDKEQDGELDLSPNRPVPITPAARLAHVLNYLERFERQVGYKHSSRST